MSPVTSARRALRTRWVVGVIVVGLLLAAIAVWASVGTPPAQSALVSTQPAATSLPASTTTPTSVAPNTTEYQPPTTVAGVTSTATTLYTHPIQDPVRVIIPAIGANALVVKVGVLDNGGMEVPPFGLAGWFRVGPAPGASGPAVIVGHVDSKKGPDVFYRLKELAPGDEIFVHDQDGDVARFVVDSSELVLKSELPTERIWNDTSDPVIRLITCGGKFDRSTGHYLSNTIVYGHLVQ